MTTPHGFVRPGFRSDGTRRRCRSYISPVSSTTAIEDLAVAVGSAVKARPSLRHVQSVLVSWRRETVVEHYFRDRRANDHSNLHSVTKSFLSTLVGIAIGDACLALTTKLAELEAFAFDLDERKRQITVLDLLTMTSGLAAEDGWDIDEIADRGESWVAGTLAAPLITEPSTKFTYNNGAAHVLSVVVAAATGNRIDEFAERRLFEPLGINDYRWPRDPDQNPLGYGHLELRPRDMLALGQLYLAGGRCEDAQLVPADYIDASTTAATEGGDPEGVGYGYLWWCTQIGAHDAFFAGGFGGQYIVVVPPLDLVVVTTGDVDVWTPTSDTPLRLVADVVVPLVEQLQ
jgi:CubicO group peptidase (beta-lactamase class C family)